MTRNQEFKLINTELLNIPYEFHILEAFALDDVKLGD